MFENQPRTFNRFNGMDSTWNSSILFPPKYDDLHGCHLTLVTHSQQGYLPEFFPTLAGSMNFILDVEISETLTPELISDKDFFRMFHTFYSDISKFIVTKGFKIVQFSYFVPDGEPYTQFEKMWMMFDPDVWIAICCTLLFWAASIQVINRSSQKLRNFIYGRGITTPTVNLLDTFLNGGQFKVPTRNFARFIFMLFVIWCLIIRVCYQSMLFQFLQSDLRRERITSFNETKGRNLTIFAGYENPE